MKDQPDGSQGGVPDEVSDSGGLAPTHLRGGATAGRALSGAPAPDTSDDLSVLGGLDPEHLAALLQTRHRSADCV